VALADERVHDVPPIQLAHGHQVQCRGQNACPGSSRNRMHKYVRRLHSRHNPGFQDSHDAGRSEHEVSFGANAGNDLRVCDANCERRNYEQKPGKRTGNSDVE
jgi:hypothetical protein